MGLLNALKQHPNSEVDCMLKKSAFIREPKERIVSADQNKFSQIENITKNMAYVSCLNIA